MEVSYKNCKVDLVIYRTSRSSNSALLDIISVTSGDLRHNVSTL